MIRFLIFFMFFSSVSYAQDSLESKITDIKKGQVASYDGSLLNPTAIAKILAEKEYAKKQCDLDKNYDLDKLKAQCNLNIGNIKIELEIAKQKYDEINKIKDSENSRITELLKKSESNSNRWLWFAVGFVSGTALTIGVTYAILGVYKAR